jgi:hypothetical protein
MSTHTVRDDQGRITAIITFADIYQFKGFIFEHHRYSGPMKLKKDLEPAKCEGRKFWKVWGEWNKLTDEEKEETRI